MESRKKRQKGEATYSYAHDEHGHRVDIKAKFLNREYCTQHAFYCIGCGKRMYASLKDDLKCRYFAHNGNQCSYESYLHQLSKSMLKSAFDRAETFFLKYDIKVSCTKTDCALRCARCNDVDRSRDVNLKEWYDKCEVEKEVTGRNGNKYIADLLLSSSKRDIPPLLLEIFVTHECPAEKKVSGLWIVELKIEQEQDIENICELGRIEESETVRLYNFERKKKEKISIDFPRYVHFPDGESCIRHLRCESLASVMDENSDLEMNLSPPYSSDHDYDYGDSFLKDYIDQRYGTCSDIPETDRVIPKIRREIRVLPIKGQLPEDNILMLYGPHKFFNTDFLVRQITHYLEVTDHPGRILFRTFSDSYFSGCVLTAAEKLFFFTDFEPIHWTKEGKSAGYKCAGRLLNTAHAAIILDNGKDKITRFIIEETKKMSIPTFIVDLNQYPDICPECGGSIIMKHGRFGTFYGCSQYPDCNYIRKEHSAEGYK